MNEIVIRKNTLEAVGEQKIMQSMFLAIFVESTQKISQSILSGRSDRSLSKVLESLL